MQRVFKSLNTRKKSMLFKIFLNLLVLSTVVIILLTIVALYWIRQKTTEDLNKMNKTLLLNTDVIYSNYLLNFDRLSNELYQNLSVKRLMTQENFTLDTNGVNIVNQINNIMSANNYINSIYLLNSTGTILNISKKFEDDNLKEEIFQAVSERKVSEGPLFWNINSRYNDSSKNIKTMTVFFHEGVKKGSTFGGGIAVNIDLEILEKSIFSDKVNKNQNFYIIDHTGRVIIHNNMKSFNLNLSAEPYIQKILSSKSSYGNFTEKYQDENYVFSYMSSSTGDYFIISQMEYRQSIQELLKATSVFTIVGLILLVIVIVASAYISYLLYKPLDNIVNNVRTMLTDPNPKDKINEVQYLSNSFNKMIDKLNSLEKENKYSKIVRLFTSVDMADKILLEELLIKIGAVKPNIPCTLAVVKIDNFNELSKNNTPEALSFQINSISTIMEEIISKVTPYFSLQYQNDQLILFLSEEGKDLTNLDIVEIITEAVSAVSKILNISVTVGISDTTNNIGDISCQYNYALNNTKYRLFFGKGSVITHALVSSLLNVEIHENYYTPVINAIKNNSYSEFQLSFNTVLDIGKKYTYDHTVTFLLKMTMSMMELSRNIVNVQNYNYVEMYNTITNLENKEELTLWITELSEEIRSIINDAGNKRIRNIMQETVEFINVNYADQQLSAGILAERLSISPQYFSKIFYEVTGSSLPDYINNVRLEKAKDMLINDVAADINSIAERIGFRSSTYFSTVFKKKYGVTPSKLRISSFSADNLGNHTKSSH